MRPLAGWAALVACTAGCVPMAQQDLPNGDHVVTSYLRLQGASEARDDNLWAARQTCHGGVVIIGEENGFDGYGPWRRLIYGCVAPDSAGASASQNSGPSSPP
jgi:hypothetical protein